MKTEWVLILTLIGATVQSGQAIEHISGFQSRQQCIDAGNLWIEQIRKAIDGSYRPARALCVRRDSHPPN